MATASSDARVVAEIEHELATLRLDGSDAIGAVLPRMSELLGLDVVNAYGLAEGTTGYELTRFHGVGFAHNFIPRFSAFLAAAPRRYGLFDPSRPEPSQRNRVVEAQPRAEPSRPEQQIMVKVLGPSGLGTHRQLRILLCEGPSLLGWFGALSTEPFTPRHRRLLRRLGTPLHRRLLAERRAARGQLAAAAFDVLLEAVASPAFVIDARGAVRETNAAARRLLATRDRDTRQALVDALAHRPTSVPVRLTRLHDRGIAVHWLAVVDVDHIEARVSAAAQRYRLTPRETEALGWIARGATNQRIAAELGCSERTVELHVTHILVKADVGSRTALVAALLAPT
jgi:DNA-binding CsgD family transcriptional regulator